MYTESLAIRRALGDKWHIAQSLLNLGHVRRNQGDVVRARSHFVEMLHLCQELGIPHAVADGIAGLGGVEVVVGNSERAATLFRAVAGLLRATGAALGEIDRDEYERYLGLVQAHMDDARFTSVWTQGQAMTMEQVIDYALERIPEIDERDA